MIQRMTLIFIGTFLIISILSGFISNTIFLPSEKYLIFTYIYTFSAMSFFVYKIIFDNPKLKEVKNMFNIMKYFSPIQFIVLAHLSLVGMLNSLPSLFTNLPVEKTIQVKVIGKNYQSGRKGNNCHYTINTQDSFYYGKICTKEKFLDLFQVGDTIQISGKINFFGFSGKVSDFEKQYNNSL